jgi:hypothetical protein
MPKWTAPVVIDFVGGHRTIMFCGDTSRHTKQGALLAVLDMWMLASLPAVLVVTEQVLSPQTRDPQHLPCCTRLFAACAFLHPALPRMLEMCAPLDARAAAAKSDTCMQSSFVLHTSAMFAPKIPERVVLSMSASVGCKVLSTAEPSCDTRAGRAGCPLPAVPS